MSGIVVVHYDGVLARTSSEIGMVPYTDGLDLWRRLAANRPTLVTCEKGTEATIPSLFVSVMPKPTWVEVTGDLRGEEYVAHLTRFAARAKTTLSMLLTARTIDAVAMSSTGYPAVVYVKPVPATALRKSPGAGAWEAMYNPEQDSSWAFVDEQNEAEDELTEVGSDG